MTEPETYRCPLCGGRAPAGTEAQPLDVTIRYQLMDGRDAKVRLHQVGHREEWVLDLYIEGWQGLSKSHQHVIDGEPEVTIR